MPSLDILKVPQKDMERMLGIPHTSTFGDRGCVSFSTYNTWRVSSQHPNEDTLQRMGQQARRNGATCFNYSSEEGRQSSDYYIHFYR